MQYLESKKDLLTCFTWNLNSPKTDNEGVYYDKCAKHLTDGQCWDKKLYTTTEYNYGIEFCDILFENKIFHVKKYKSSAMNSHLLL